ncbi:MAG: hypothetical protein EGQ87_00085 [Clostridiales bacterium]|nr:hypothetical protein [Clostridiales bacterium]
MAEVKEKHPSWFKLKTERRQLIKELPPESAVNVLLACLDFLEVGSFPKAMRPIEKIAASAFLPDLEEAWTTYEKRVKWGSKGGRPPTKNRKEPYGCLCSHKQPCETEVEEDSPKGEDSSNSYGGAAFRSGTPAPKYIPEFPVEDAE